MTSRFIEIYQFSLRHIGCFIWIYIATTTIFSLFLGPSKTRKIWVSYQKCVSVQSYLNGSAGERLTKTYLLKIMQPCIRKYIYQPGLKLHSPWRYYVVFHGYMMTSSNGNIFRVTGPLCREFTGPGEFPAQRPVTRSFDVFFDLRLNNDWVNNREAGDLRPHRGHYDVNVMILICSTVSKWRRFWSGLNVLTWFPAASNL